MKNVVRYALIGAGNQGTYYANELLHKGLIENAKLVVVCDKNQAKIERIKNVLNDPSIKYVEDYREILDASLVDAILIETPHYDHPQIAIDAFKKGINVLCDKPAGVYTRQVKEMNLEAEKHNVLFTMMFNQRTNSLYKKVKEMIEQNILGKLQRVTWIITDWFRTEKYYASGEWRATWNKEGGGVLINQCPHQLDLLLWLINKKVKSVRAFCEYGKFHDIEVEDDATAIIEFEDGLTGTFIASTGEFPGTNRLEISGTKGKILIDSNLDSKLLFFKNEKDAMEYSKEAKEAFPIIKSEKEENITDGTNPQHIEILRNFTQAILGKEKLFVDGKEGIKQVELMNAIELSGWNDGEKISLPIDEDRYYKELMNHAMTSKKKSSNDEILDGITNSFGAINKK